MRDVAGGVDDNLRGLDEVFLLALLLVIVDVELDRGVLLLGTALHGLVHLHDGRAAAVSIAAVGITQFLAAVLLRLPVGANEHGNKAMRALGFNHAMASCQCN